MDEQSLELDRQRLKSLRLGQKMTAQELGKRAGLSVHAIHKLEQGRRRASRAATVYRLASALGVPARALLVGAGDEPEFEPADLLLMVDCKRLRPEERQIVRLLVDQLLAAQDARSVACKFLNESDGVSGGTPPAITAESPGRYTSGVLRGWQQHGRSD